MNSTQYISGQVCGTYLTLETTDKQFHLYDVDDVLDPKFLMELPHPKGFVSLMGGNEGLYKCIADYKIILLMGLPS